MLLDHQNVVPGGKKPALTQAPEGKRRPVTPRTTWRSKKKKKKRSLFTLGSVLSTEAIGTLLGPRKQLKQIIQIEDNNVIVVVIITGIAFFIIATLAITIICGSSSLYFLSFLARSTKATLPGNIVE